MRLVVVVVRCRVGWPAMRMVPVARQVGQVHSRRRGRREFDRAAGWPQLGQPMCSTSWWGSRTGTCMPASLPAPGTSRAGTTPCAGSAALRGYPGRGGWQRRRRGYNRQPCSSNGDGAEHLIERARGSPPSARPGAPTAARHTDPRRGARRHRQRWSACAAAGPGMAASWMGGGDGPGGGGSGGGDERGRTVPAVEPVPPHAAFPAVVGKAGGPAASRGRRRPPEGAPLP